MGKKHFTLALIVVLALCFVALPGYAKDSKSKVPTESTVTAAPASQMSEQQKNLLTANINALRNQELRVAVLQQLLNEATSQLMQTQAVFCDQYNLNTDKFRQGKYQLDATTGKFTERPEAKQ